MGGVVASPLSQRKSAHLSRLLIQNQRGWNIQADIAIRPSSSVPCIGKTSKMAPVLIKRILISESVDACCKKILQENGIEVTEKLNMSKDELIADIKVKSCCSIFQILLNLLEPKIEIVSYFDDIRCARCLLA